MRFLSPAESKLCARCGAVPARAENAPETLKMPRARAAVAVSGVRDLRHMPSRKSDGRRSRGQAKFGELLVKRRARDPQHARGFRDLAVACDERVFERLLLELRLGF